MRHLRELVSLGWPMLVAQLAVMANAVADTMLTGHYDAKHLAAIGIGASVYFTVFVTSMGMLQSLSPLIARRFGANELAAIGVLVRQGVLAALALAVPGTLILAHPEPLLALIDPPGEVAAIAAAYLRATAIGVPAAMLVRVYVALVPAVLAYRLPLLTTLQRT